MMTSRPAYQAYLLRLWRTAAGQWRASLEDAHTGERLAFATLEQMAAFLGQETAEGTQGQRAGPLGSPRVTDEARRPPEQG